MTRTLADMTPSERQECIGMWVKVTPTGGNSPSRTPFLGVLASLDANAYWGKGGYVVRGPHTSAFYFAEMELQPDLPRAWTPEGEPVPGVWQYHPAYTGVYQDGTTSLDLIGVETYSKQQAEGECADIHRDDPAVHFSHVRRYTTDWEEA